MTYDLLFEACIQAAMTWPLNHTLRGPITITAVDVPEDLRNPPPYAAYLAGHFWNRNWVAEGAQESTMRIDRAIIGIERKRVMVNLPAAKEGCSEVWITMVDDPCGPGTGCQREETIEELHRRLLTTLTHFIQRVAYWEIWKLSDGTHTVLNPLLPGFIAPEGATKTIWKLFEAGEVDVRVTDLSQEVSLNNGRSVAVGLTTCGCIPSLVSSDFVSYTRPPGLGETRCPLC